MTELEAIIRSMIAADGPMPLDRYMSLCLNHPVHGYYMTRDPFGRSGDFTTAPEISQIFGELIGVWCAQVWQALGAPRKFALVELGPGRGTLMADMLRVLGRLEGLAKAAQVHFVEISPVLREAQQSRVPGATWHNSVASLPALPSVIIANEFFDALPIRQFERKQGRVFERCIGLAGEALAIGLVPSPHDIPLRGEGLFEDGSIRNAVALELGHHLRTVRGAALVIDYGHGVTRLGDTLQAVKAHSFVAITEAPGEADITSHVDFEGLGRAFANGGARIAGLMPQGDFLNAMGLAQRSEVLARTISAEAKTEIATAAERLAHPDQMGHLFKVMAVTGAGLPAPYPFGAT